MAAVMHTRPVLRRPRPPLAEHVELVGHWQGSGTSYRSRALPRGAVTVIVDVGQRQHLDFYAADGQTRLSVPPAFITGAHSASYVSDIAANEPVMAIHFRPGGASAFLGIPLGELENRHVGIDHVWGRTGRELHDRLIDASSVEARFGLLEHFLLSTISPRRHPGVCAAMAEIEANPSVRMAELGRLTGLSTKRLIALFRDEVGLSPKEYARVRRFQAALLRLADGVGGARIAAELGYFDQAHFVREFRSFTQITPTQYSADCIVLPSHVPVDGPPKNTRPPRAA
jgi:AraC-like DNA-binding protein